MMTSRYSVLREFLGTAAVLSALVLLSSPSTGQCPVSKISELSSNDLDEFGWRIALDGDLLAVGELGADLSGSVHLFDVSGVGASGRWSELAEVQPGDNSVGQHFSEALALSGGTLAVGVPQDGDLFFGSGATYVFEQDDNGTPADLSDDSWVETAKLYGGGSPPAKFGHSVALAGDTLVVGAPGNFTDAGITIYQRLNNGTASPLDDTWLETAFIPHDGLSAFTEFGGSVDISADQNLIMVTDTRDTTGPGTTGAALTFVRSDVGVSGDPLDDVWLPTGKLYPAPFANPFDFFGRTVVIGPDLAMVGSNSSYTGDHIEIYDRDDQNTPDPIDDVWTHAQTLVGSDYFGPPALDGDRFVVSEPLPDFPTGFGGRILVYERTAGIWGQVSALRAPDDQFVDGLGDSLALDGSLIFAGASGAEYIDDWSPADGATYVWDANRPDTWERDTYGHHGEAPLFAGWGSLEAGSLFGVRSYDLFSDVTTWMILGLNRVDLPFKDGVLVPSPDVIVGPLSTDMFGSVELQSFWPANVPPGTELWFQSWTLDTTFGTTWAGSPGVSAITP